MSFRAGVLAVGLLVACGPAPPPSEGGDFSELVPPTVAETHAAGTREAFLAQLAPLPHRSVHITYEVNGPGGMHGSLQLLAAPGGWRSETWALQLPAPGQPIPLEGVAVQTPDRSWSDAVDGAAVVRPMPLGPIADAYLDLAESERARVLANVRSFHAELAAGVRANPGTREEIGGIDCLVTRVAGHRLCVWEQTGLPLSYAGPAFAVVASGVVLDEPMPEGAFDVPDGGRRPADDAAPIDAADSVQRLANGDVAELAMILQPGLRVPASL